MARAGHRYHLLLYSHTLNRWWKLVLAIGLVLLVMAAAMTALPLLLPQSGFPLPSDSAVWIAGGIGIFTVVLGLILFTIRKWAYVRPFSSYLCLVTPLLRLNISYKRIRQASSVEMQRLFPLERYKGWRRKFLRPLAGQTAIVLEMSAWPLSPNLLRVFLSPFFFPDRTPRLALLVNHWIDFSTELESFRGAWLEEQRKPERTPQSDLLASFARSKR